MEYKDSIDLSSTSTNLITYNGKPYIKISSFRKFVVMGSGLTLAVICFILSMDSTTFYQIISFSAGLLFFAAGRYN